MQWVAGQALFSAVSHTHGQLLIQVWALEQGQEKTRRSDLQPATLSSLQSQAQAHNEQDVFVPWTKQMPNGSTLNTTVHQRYYHLFKQGELLSMVRDVAQELGFSVIDQGEDGDSVTVSGRYCRLQEVWERGNYVVMARLHSS